MADIVYLNCICNIANWTQFCAFDATHIMANQFKDMSNDFVFDSSIVRLYSRLID